MNELRIAHEYTALEINQAAGFDIELIIESTAASVAPLRILLSPREAETVGLCLTDVVRRHARGFVRKV